MRAVFDTNIFVSAFVFPASSAERAFLLAQAKQVQLATSVAILAETARVLREKFLLDDDDVQDVLRRIARVATLHKPTLKLDVVSDEPDNRVLECAVASNADLIVSGDRHLLKLKSFEGIAIARLADFLHLFPEDAT